MHYINYKELGQRIAKQRRDRGLKQWQVNEMAGLSDKYLSNIERATSVLSIDVLMRLCSALDTTPDALLLGTETEADSAKAIISKIHLMTPEQEKLALSLMDWILTLKI